MASTTFVTGTTIASEWLNTVNTAVFPTSKTVATLPSATTSFGYRFIVSDANATTFASTVAGGGSNKVPVYSDGTVWRIG